MMSEELHQAQRKLKAAERAINGLRRGLKKRDERIKELEALIQRKGGRYSER